MIEEKERLVLHNLRLAGYMAQKYKSTGIDFDELTSISYMGLVKAANSYQPERGKVFFFGLPDNLQRHNVLHQEEEAQYTLHLPGF